MAERENKRWVGTWATTPSATDGVALDGQTVRMIVHTSIGGGTLRADRPRLDVRLRGLENRAPKRVALTSGTVPEGWLAIRAPEDIAQLDGVRYLMVEGGAQTASAFLKCGLVDRLIVYRAPVLLGGGTAAIGDIGHETLEKAFSAGLSLRERRQLGSDTLEVYQRG